MDEIPITAQAAERFGTVLGAEAASRFAAELAAVSQRLAGHTMWHVNSTAEGGGVAEMLQSILGYPLGCGVPVRWLVLGGNDEFFEVTKRIHHLLHGSPGDGGPLGDAERRIYDDALAPESQALGRLVQPGDPVVLHDPQSVGLAPALVAAGARVIWSCHVGADEPNDHTRSAWQFLQPYTTGTLRQVFSRREYAWSNLDPGRISVIPPCLDAFSAKNQLLADDGVAAILSESGVLPAPTSAAGRFTRRDGTEAQVRGRAEMVQDEAIPPTARLVTQISRWDPLKDHAGVMAGFCRHANAIADSHLVLAGPTPESITDDPEGQRTLDELRATWRGLPDPARRRVHIACLPMDDIDENAAIVNALQRRSDVVVQKSLAEGFGLTVAEAMWKSRPVVGSRVGGIQDQIEPGVCGLLVEPDDEAGLAEAITSLLTDRDAAEAMGAAGHERVRTEYLAPRYLQRYFALVGQALAA